MKNVNMLASLAKVNNIGNSALKNFQELKQELRRTMSLAVSLIPTSITATLSSLEYRNPITERV